jgi:hypothetical protein
MKTLIASALLALFWLQPAYAATYNVGPGQTYSSIASVPWESLVPGDIVQIHWRTTPYKEKWVINRRGTAAQPIIVRGVPGPAGQFPIIDGDGATTRPQLGYYSEARGIINIATITSGATDVFPAYIVVEGLEIINARPAKADGTPIRYTNRAGALQTFPNNAAAIYVEKGEFITLRNNIIRDNGNGLFTISSDDPNLVSRDILIEGNWIYGNGNPGSSREHGTYCASQRITYQYNRYGRMVSGSIGGALKDRSSGVTVRYNWLEGTNRQLEILDAEDSVLLRNDPSYRESFVYGNVFIEGTGDGNRQVMQYGGDHPGMEHQFRKGWLYFFNNTVVSTRTDGSTTMFRISSNDESADIRNNIFYVTAGGSNLRLLADDAGNAAQVNYRNNWFNTGWVVSLGAHTATNGGGNITGSGPGFQNEADQNYLLTPSSIARNAGTLLHSAILSNILGLNHSVLSQYLKHTGAQLRPIVGTIDIGAFEQGTGTAAPAAPSNIRITQ